MRPSVFAALPLFRNAGTVLMLALAVACVAACEREPTLIEPPTVSLAMTPAATAEYPTITAARISTAAAHDTIEFTVAHLPPTGLGNTYQIALVDTASLRGAGIIARVVRTTRTSAGAVATDTTVGGQFSIADTSTSVQVRLVSSQLVTYTHVVLRSAGEGSVPSTLDAAARTGFLAFRFRAGASFAIQAEPFGAWSPNSASRLHFDGAGTVTGAGIWGAQVRLDFANLTRPPAGFRYSAWLVSSRTAGVVRLGGLLAPAPSERSLDDADLGTGPWFTARAVTSARVRADLSRLGASLSSFTSLVLVLESYGGFGAATAPGTATVFAAPLP